MPTGVPPGIAAIAMALLLFPEPRVVLPTEIEFAGQETVVLQLVGVINCLPLLTVPVRVTFAGNPDTAIEFGVADTDTVVWADILFAVKNANKNKERNPFR